MNVQSIKTAMEAAKPPEPESAAPAPEENESRESQATQLVNFARARVELFHDKNKQVYAHHAATSETRRLDSRAFRDWLLAGFYDETGVAPREQAMREALNAMAGLGRQRGELRAVFVRVAGHEGGYLVDLAEPGQSRAVCVRPGGWEIVTAAPVHFFAKRSHAAASRTTTRRLFGGPVAHRQHPAGATTACAVLVVGMFAV